MSANPHYDALNDSDDDQFYSLPTTREASRHVSIAPSRLVNENNVTPESLPSDKSALDSDRNSLGGNDSVLKMPSESSSGKGNWTLPFKHQSDTKHRHFCAKPMISRVATKRLSSFEYDADAVTLRSQSYEELHEEPLTIEQLVSSPAAPITTERWSSTSIGSPLRFVKSHSSLGGICSQDQAASKNDIETVVSDICTYLSGMRHDDCPRASAHSRSTTPARESGETSAIDPGDESFLISIDDIAEILDIVIRGMRKLHGKHIPTGCLSVLLRKDSNARPSAGSNSIVPPSSCLVGPATTFSSVKPLFTAIGHGEVHQFETKSTRATFISKQSVTEVSWNSTPARSIESRETCKSISIRAEATSNNFSSSVSRRARTTPVSPIGGDILAPLAERVLAVTRRRSSEPIGDAVVGRQKSLGRMNTSASSETDIATTILGSDLCSDDWDTASEGVRNSDRASLDFTTTLYECGIDAHTSAEIATDSAKLHRNCRTVMMDSLDAPCVRFTSRRSVDRQYGLVMGTPIDISPYRRTSSARPKHGQGPTPAPNLTLDKLRRYSFIPLEAQDPESSRRDRYPLQPPQIEDVPLREQGKQSSKELLEEILVQATSRSFLKESCPF